jgi:dTDP-4-amino-4,6-dideoxygalactose transaminase
MAIQLFVPTFDVDACLENIRQCLEKGWTGMGFMTVQFEEKWKEYTGLPHAYYLNSATAGLNLAVEIFKEKYGWADGDEIITTPLTFISTNHAILLSKMKAVFADVYDTLCLDPASVEERITDKSRAVMYVGMGGNAGHLDQIIVICKKNNLKLILDAAHVRHPRKRRDCRKRSGCDFLFLPGGQESSHR